MGTINETMWVHDKGELDGTVQRLITQGGVVQYQGDDAVTIYVKKKINIPVLVVGLILCLVPGLVYLVWYLSDKDQQVSVRIGQPESLNYNAGAGEHHHWYNEEAQDGAAPGTIPATPPAQPAAVEGTPAAAVPPAMPPAAVPAPAPPPPPVAAPAPAAPPTEPPTMV